MRLILFSFFFLLLVCVCLFVSICSCLCVYMSTHVHACGSQRLAWVSLTEPVAKFTDSSRPADQKPQGSPYLCFPYAKITGIYFT